MAAKKTAESSQSAAAGRTNAKRSKPAAGPANSQKKSITLEELKREIAVRAHQIFQERLAAGLPGDDLSDWLAAEAEIKKKHKLH